MPGLYPSGVRAFPSDMFRMYRPVLLDQSVDNLAENTLDDHLFTVTVVAGHERPHEAFCGHASQAVSVVNDDGLDSHSGGGDGRAGACGTSSYHEQIRFVSVGNILHSGKIRGFVPACGHHRRKRGRCGDDAAVFQKISSVH